MPLDPLTAKQRTIVDAIEQLTEQYNYPPTIKELAEQVQLSPSTVTGYLARLTRMGVLERVHQGRRKLRVVDRYRRHPMAPGATTVPVSDRQGRIEHRPVVRILNMTHRAFLLDVAAIGANRLDVQAGDRVIVDPGRPPRLGFPCVVLGDDGRMHLVESFTGDTLRLGGKPSAIVALFRGADQLTSKSAGSAEGAGTELAG